MSSNLMHNATYIKAIKDAISVDSTDNPIPAYFNKTLETVRLDSVKEVGSYAFCGHTSLKTALFPAATRIGEYAFNGCSAMTTVDFRAVTEIYSGSIRDCTSLRVVDFASLRSINGDYSLCNCSSLIAIILRNTNSICEFNANKPFNGCCHLLGRVDATYNPEGLKDGYIYVPSALIEEYKANLEWRTYASQFRVLEDYTVDGTTTGELDMNKI